MSALQAPLAISFGTNLSVTIEPDRPLRLSTMSWDFPEWPDLIALAERAERLDFLRDRLKSLCGLWDKLPRLFLDAYFNHVGACVVANRVALEAAAQRLGGLFAPEDWSYAGLCPLPRAQLPASDNPADLVSVDFAFWTGEGLYAVDIVGTTTTPRWRRGGRERLGTAGISVLEIPGVDLQRDGAGVLAQLLTAPFSNFWKTEPLPSSPFRIGRLDEILPA
jgi:hypothetical protein